MSLTDEQIDDNLPYAATRPVFLRQLAAQAKEANALLEDAERYRWLRDTRRLVLGPVVGRTDQYRYILASSSLGYCKPDVGSLDAAIDSAIKQENPCLKS